MAEIQNSPHGVPTSPIQDETEEFALTQISDVFSPNLSIEEPESVSKKTEVASTEVADTTKSESKQEVAERENAEVAAISQAAGASSGNAGVAMEGVTKPTLLAGVPMASSTPVSEGAGTPNASVAVVDQAKGVEEVTLFDDSTDATVSSRLQVGLTEPLTIKVSTSAETDLGKPVSGASEEQITTGFQVAGIEQVVPVTGAKPVFDSTKGAQTAVVATNPSTQVVKMSGNSLPMVRVPSFQPTNTSVIGAISGSITVLSTSTPSASGATTKTCKCLLVLCGVFGSCTIVGVF